VYKTAFFTIDVEEYYHICGAKSAPLRADWDSLQVTVEKNLMRLLEIFALHKVKTTCFFLGYIARKHPGLVRETLQQGHEIASHGMYHQVVYDLTQAEIRADVTDAKHLLEDIAGQEVIGYRSPSFSATDKTPWLYETLIETGYKYDSSLFPASRADGGMVSGHTAPHFIKTQAGKILEFPISVAPVLGKSICFFGGGYLRLFPIKIILNQAEYLYRKGSPVLYYIHPREIDPQHPRLPLSVIKNFKTYVNLTTVKAKLDKILTTGSFMTLRDYYLTKVSEQAGHYD
jgi:polysaccharide deacetylase family protein (PEP-CTERM system associated)